MALENIISIQRWRLASGLLPESNHGKWLETRPRCPAGQPGHRSRLAEIERFHSNFRCNHSAGANQNSTYCSYLLVTVTRCADADSTITEHLTGKATVRLAPWIHLVGLGNFFGRLIFSSLSLLPSYSFSLPLFSPIPGFSPSRSFFSFPFHSTLPSLLLAKPGHRLDADERNAALTKETQRFDTRLQAAA